MTIYERAQRFFGQVITPFYVLRAPLIAAGVGAFMLAMPAQTREIYRALALGYQTQVPQIAFALISLVMVGTFIWYVGRNLTLIWQQHEMQNRSLSSLLLRWMPRLVGSLPLLGAAIGLYGAAGDIPVIEVSEAVAKNIPGLKEEVLSVRAQMDAGHNVLILGALTCVTLAILLIGITWLRSFHKRWKYEQPNPFLFSTGSRSVFTFLTFTIVIGLSVFFFTNPRELSAFSSQVGALTAFNTFLICITFLLSFGTNIYDTTKVPALLLLVLIAAISSAFDLNDNHRIRTLDREVITQAEPGIRSLSNRAALGPRQRLALRYRNARESFEDWFASRPDRNYYAERGRPYPVYVVAAQGGGLYAAQQVATTLARMQDRCAAFAQHVFAISSVSGGSLGAATFAALVKHRNERFEEPRCQFGAVTERWYETQAQRVLSKDFMAPLTVAGFFPDFIQRFIPWPIQRFDRARALEASFERAWDDAFPDARENLFASNYLDHWDRNGNVPALIMNATWVETGSRTVFSPFHFRQQTSDQLVTMLQLIRQPVALSTAVSVSARFPWVLPPASWKVEPRSRPAGAQAAPIGLLGMDRSSRMERRERMSGARYYRFVDGGYFEYSGSETAVDIVQIIDDLQASRAADGQPALDIEVHLIVIADDEIVEDAHISKNYVAKNAQKTAKAAFAEVLTPISTMLQSRLSRAYLSGTRAFDRVCPGCFRSRTDQREFPGFDGRGRMFRINHTDFGFTVGWQLSPATQRMVAMHAGEADRCFAQPGDRGRSSDWFVKVINENNCSACRVVYDLSVQPYEGGRKALSRSAIVQSDREPLNPYQLDLPPEGRLICAPPEASRSLRP